MSQIEQIEQDTASATVSDTPGTPDAIDGYADYTPRQLAEWRDRVVSRGGQVHPSESQSHTALALLRLEVEARRTREVLEHIAHSLDRQAELLAEHIAHSLDRQAELLAEMATPPGRKRGT